MKTTLIVYLILVSGLIAAAPDSVKRYDPQVDGRPFSLDEILGKTFKDPFETDESGFPAWARSGMVEIDTVYYGIGQSTISQADADDLARLEFGKMVEVRVNSLARQMVMENQEQLVEAYSYEALVSTDLSLRGIEITERFTPDSVTYYSLIQYGKAAYQRLVTQELTLQLTEDIERQKARLAAQQTLRADSLQHKLIMDSLALAKEQARVDSAQRVLDMQRAAVEQKREARRILQEKYADFLALRLYHRGIEGYTAALPAGYGDLAVRWNPDNSNVREIHAGGSFSILGIETALWLNEFIVENAELSGRLQILPPRGDIFKVSLLFGYVGYLGAVDEVLAIDLSDSESLSDGLDAIQDPDGALRQHMDGSFLIGSNLGIPQYNMHLALYGDKRRITFTDTWFPFVHSLGDAISLVFQIDYFMDEHFQNRFGDEIEGQAGIRLIAIEDRFATLLSYEDHEWWRLTFELQF